MDKMNQRIPDNMNDDYYIELWGRMNALNGKKIDQKVISLLPDTNYCIKSIPGQKKNIIKLTKDRKTLWITHRKLQAVYLSRKYGFVHLSESNIKDEMKSSFICDVHSLHLVKDNIMLFDYLIICDVESVLRKIFHPSSERYMMDNQLTLCHLLVNIPHYIVIDSELSLNTSEICRNLSFMKSHPEVIINEYKEKREAFIIEDMQKILNDLKNGLKVIIGCSVEKTSKKIYDLIKEQIEDINIIHWVGNKETISNIQCLIFTFSDEIRLSVNEKHFNNLYVYYDHKGISSIYITQTIRKLKIKDKVFLMKPDLKPPIIHSNDEFYLVERNKNLISYDQLIGRPPSYVCVRLQYEILRDDLDSHCGFQILTFKLRDAGFI